MNIRAALTAPLVLVSLVILPLALATCVYQPLLGDYWPMVDCYNTETAAYKVVRGQCVAVVMQAQPEYERQQRLKRVSNMTIRLIGEAIAGAAVGGTLGALEGGLAETDYDPLTSPSTIVDHYMKNRDYEIPIDLGRGA